MYKRQLGRIKHASRKDNQSYPTLIGEFGLHMDLYNGKAYKKWAKGNHSQEIWKKHVFALDLMYNAMDSLMLNSTLWNYTASNRNDPKIGDGWNQEDLSIFSEDQHDRAENINSGARAIKGWCRPFARFIQGIPKNMEFNMRSGEFRLKFTADSSIAKPTEIYIPKIQYPEGYNLEIRGSKASYIIDDLIIKITAKESNETEIMIKRK